MYFYSILVKGMIHQKRGGALCGLRINREILILRKPPIEVVLLYSDSNRKYLFKHHTSFQWKTLTSNVVYTYVVKK